MATFLPFRGIRATEDKMHLVASRSFLSYTELELQDKLMNNPFTFLHVIQPTQRRDVSDQQKFEEVRKVFDTFISQGVFIQEQEPSFYLYRQRKDGRDYLGWMGGIAVEDYRNGVVKLHEHTIERRENLFAEYLAITGINAEPVLMFSRFSSAFKNWMVSLTNAPALSNFSTTDKAQHTIWKIDGDEEKKRIQQEFEGLKAIYLADGHHRSASSERLEAMHPEWPGTHQFLSFVMDESSLHIHPFHRALTELNMTPAELVMRLNDVFEKIEIPFGEIPKGCFAVVTSSGMSGYRFLESEEIDPDKLSTQVLLNILGITDLRNDKRIRFIEGPKGLSHIEDMVNLGKYTCAFLLSAVSTDELCSVADRNGVMPPKSTYVEPKLRSGLIIYPINHAI
jgi:uncharacterized protein (DUF1015 family)